MKWIAVQQTEVQKMHLSCRCDCFSHSIYLRVFLYGKEMVLKENKRIRLLKYLEIFCEVKIKKRKKTRHSHTHILNGDRGRVRERERESTRESNELKFCRLYYSLVAAAAVAVAGYLVVVVDVYCVHVSTCHAFGNYTVHTPLSK